MKRGHARLRGAGLSAAVAVLAATACAGPGSPARPPTTAAPAAPGRGHIAQFSFGPDATFRRCVEPACPVVTRKTLAGARPASAAGPASSQPFKAPASPAMLHSVARTADRLAAQALGPERDGAPTSRPATASDIRHEPTFAAAADTLLARIALPVGSAALSGEARALVAVVVIRVQPGQRIAISGRTDSAGTRNANRTLALTRELAVRNAIRDAKPGLLNTIAIDARGNCCFIAADDRDSGRARNRRVDVFLTPAGAV